MLYLENRRETEPIQRVNGYKDHLHFRYYLVYDTIK